MSDAAVVVREPQEPRKTRQPRLSRAVRGFKGRPLVQLTLVRFREFIREPEAVFWTFVFPILLAAGLGIAFRQKGLEQLQVGVVARPGADTAVVTAMRRDSTLVLRAYDDSAGALALRTGKVALLVIHGDQDTVVPLTDNSGALERRYRALGGEMELHVVAGHGHDMDLSFFQSEALVAFVRRHARRQEQVRDDSVPRR